MENNFGLLKVVNISDDEPEVIEIIDNDKVDDNEEIEVIEVDYLEKNLNQDDDIVEVIDHKFSSITDSKKPQIKSETNIRKPILIPAPEQNPELTKTDSNKRLFGGRMTEQRLEKVKTVTEDVITAMHNSLNTAPEDALTETPKGLSIELMRHQKVGLSWLLWRERQNPPSGILADDMGLGKTLSIISLITHKKNLLNNETDENDTELKFRREAYQGKKLIESNATLIIAPASLIYQWEKEITDRTKSGLFTVCVFHGPKREHSVFKLSSYDVVLTTYQTVSSELSEKRFNDESLSDRNSSFNSPFSKKSRKTTFTNNHSVLSKIGWNRIVLDEAHQIKNRNSIVSRAVCKLIAVHRWCLTGTPIHNELWDLYSLIRFLNVTPFSEEKMWKEFIMASTKNNAERLNTLIKGLLLRRTKEQICIVTNKPLVDLKPKKYEVVVLKLQNLERRCYDIMFEASKQKVRDIIKNQENNLFDLSNRKHKKQSENVVKNPFIGGSRNINFNDRFQQMSSVLVLLLRLRQACVHMALTRSGIDLEAFKDAGGDCNECISNSLNDDNMNFLEESLANLSLDQNNFYNEFEKNNTNIYENENNCKNIEAIFNPKFCSTKMAALLERIHNVLKIGDKCVVVSQWTSMLTIIENHLKIDKIFFTSITGAIPTKERQQRVDSFNEKNSGAKVMLLSLTAGGVGLNLVGGNHLFLIDLHWNPALEQQACDRIYRMGQQKNVFIHKFLCEKTIEQRVLELQKKKTTLATSVLEGAASKRLNKLTMNDLKFLFELDNRSVKAPVSSLATNSISNKDIQRSTKFPLYPIPD